MTEMLSLTLTPAGTLRVSDDASANPPPLLGLVRWLLARMALNSPVRSSPKRKASRYWTQGVDIARALLGNGNITRGAVSLDDFGNNAASMPVSCKIAWMSFPRQPFVPTKIPCCPITVVPLQPLLPHLTDISPPAILEIPRQPWLYLPRLHTSN